jgi:hypothetical protein
MKHTLYYTHDLQPALNTDSNHNLTAMNADKIKGGESVSTQRANILNALRQAPSTTIELREKLKIPSPAPRIFELRHNYGFNIIKQMVFDITAQNSTHKVARYFLISEGK